MATHSSILAWRIPWTEEPGKLQFRVCEESDMTEQLTLLFHRYTHTNTHTYHLSNRMRMNQDICGIPVKFPSVHAYVVLNTILITTNIQPNHAINWLGIYNLLFLACSSTWEQYFWIVYIFFSLKQTKYPINFLLLEGV